MKNWKVRGNDDAPVVDLQQIGGLARDAEPIVRNNSSTAVVPCFYLYFFTTLDYIVRVWDVGKVPLVAWEDATHQRVPLEGQHIRL